MQGVWACLRIDARSKWRSWIVLALLLAILGGAVLTAAAGARRTETAYPRLRQYVGSPDLLVAPDNTGVDGYYRALSRLPQVKAMSTLLLYGIALPGRRGLPDVNVQVEGSTGATGAYGGRVKILQGRAFDPSDPHDALIDQQVAQREHLHVGGTLQLFGIPNDAHGNPDVSRAVPLSLHVTAIAAFDDQIVPANKANGEPRVLVTPAFYRVPAYRKFHGSDGAAVSLRVGTSRAAFQRQASALAASPQYKSSTGGQIFIGDLDAQAAATERAIQPEVVALALFALLAGLITLVVMSQLLGRQMVLDAAENPILRAIGMNRSGLTILSLMRTGVVTISGAIGAVLVASVASPLMPIGPARLAEPAPGFDLNLAILGSGLAVVAFLPLVLVIPVTWRSSAPGWNAVRVTRGSGGGSFATRVSSSLGSVPASFGIRMALEPGNGRNAAPVRSAFVGITIALTAVVATMVFGASLLHLVDTPTLYGQNWDREVDLGFGAVPGPFARQVLLHQPGMTGFVLGNDAPLGTVSIGGEAVPAIGIGHVGGRDFLTMLSGNQPSGPHDVVLGAQTLQRLHRHVGDTVPVKINGNIRAMHIVGSAVFASFSRGSFDATDLGDGAAFSAPVMSESDPGTNCTGPTCYNFFLVRYRAAPISPLQEHDWRRRSLRRDARWVRAASWPTSDPTTSMTTTVSGRPPFSLQGYSLSLPLPCSPMCS